MYEHLACNLTGAVIVYFFLYESSNLSLESVDLVRPPFKLCKYLLIAFSRCTTIHVANPGHPAHGHRLVTPPVSILSNKQKLHTHTNLLPPVPLTRVKLKRQAAMVRSHRMVNCWLEIPLGLDSGTIKALVWGATALQTGGIPTMGILTGRWYPEWLLVLSPGVLIRLLGVYAGRSDGTERSQLGYGHRPRGGQRRINKRSSHSRNDKHSALGIRCPYISFTKVHHPRSV